MRKSINLNNYHHSINFKMYQKSIQNVSEPKSITVVTKNGKINLPTFLLQAHSDYFDRFSHPMFNLNYEIKTSDFYQKDILNLFKDLNQTRLGLKKIINSYYLYSYLACFDLMNVIDQFLIDLNLITKIDQDLINQLLEEIEYYEPCRYDRLFNQNSIVIILAIKKLKFNQSDQLINLIKTYQGPPKSFFDILEEICNYIYQYNLPLETRQKIWTSIDRKYFDDIKFVINFINRKHRIFTYHDLKPYLT